MELKEAIECGDVDGVKRLVSINPSLASSPIEWGHPTPCRADPLHYVSDRAFVDRNRHDRQADIAVLLLEAGASVTGTNEEETLLHGAVSLGQAGVAMVLLDYGADIEATGQYPGIPDGTPLDFAVHFGMVESIDLLVQRGAEIKSARMAAGAGQLEKLKLLPMPEPADVLRCAVVCDRTHIVDWIFTQGLSVDTPVQQATCLHWAAWEGKPVMTDHLLKLGADRTCRDRNHDMTPREWAAFRRKGLGSGWGHDEVIARLGA